MKIVGYEFAPRQEYEDSLAGFVSTGGWAGGNPAAIPSPARPVFADSAGDTFASFPGIDEVGTLPFVPGSATTLGENGSSSIGGFVSIDDMPSGGGGSDPMKSLMGSIAGSGDSKRSLDWLNRAAAQSMLGGGPNGGANRALQALGLANPAAAGPMGPALRQAAKAAGFGNASRLFPSAASLLSGGGLQGAANALGQQAVGELINNIGLGNVAQQAANYSGAASALSGLLGGGGAAASPLADMMSTGGFAGPLDSATDALSGSLADAGVNNIVEGGCLDHTGADMQASLDKLEAEAVGAIADELLSEWQVDDESSAAEQVAHKTVNDNKDKITEAISDPDGFIAKMKKFFGGVAPGTGQPAVRLTDLDADGDQSIQGVATIAFEGKPVSRMKDLVEGPKAPAPGLPIIEGAATVFSAGVETAFKTAANAVPSTMITGAESILIGGDVASVPPPPPPAPPNPNGNGGPKGPASPSGPSSGSGSAGQSGSGQSGSGQAGSSTAGNNGTAGPNANNKDWKPSNDLDRQKIEELRQLPTDTHDPEAPVSDASFRIDDPDTERYWTENGMSSSPEEYSGLPDTPFLRDLMQAQPGEKGWFGNEYEAGNWYMLGGLIDLGSPVVPGAGTGGSWWVPDKIFGMDMSSYYIPHDWKFDPASEKYRNKPWLLYTDVEIPSFLDGLAATGGNPVHAGLQVIYSGATSVAALGFWTAAKFKKPKKGAGNKNNQNSGGNQP